MMSRHLGAMEDCNEALSAMADCIEVIRLAKAVSSDRCYAKVVNSGHCRAIPEADDNLDQSACRDASPGAE